MIPHVRNRDFAKDFDPNVFLKKLIENIKPMKAGEGHFLLNALYNMEMGLFNHMDSEASRKEPLAVIRAFKEENQKSNSLLDDLAFRYRSNRIWERYHISFTEYIKLPTTKARELDDIANRIIKKIDDEEEKQKANVLNSQINNMSQD